MAHTDLMVWLHWNWFVHILFKFSNKCRSTLSSINATLCLACVYITVIMLLACLLSCYFAIALLLRLSPMSRSVAWFQVMPDINGNLHGIHAYNQPSILLTILLRQPKNTNILLVLCFQIGRMEWLLLGIRLVEILFL